MKDANKKYSAIKNNFELIFTNDTKMIECTEKIENFPNVNVKFISITEVKKLPTNDNFLNIIGICHEIKALEEFTAKKTGRCLKKREVIIIDSSNEFVPITFWNNDAENFDENNLRAAISLYNVRLNECNGKKSISLYRDSDIRYNEDIVEAKSLSSWYESQTNESLKQIMTTNEEFDTEILSIKDLFELTETTLISCIGICYDIGNVTSIFPTKTTGEIKKRNVTLVDQFESPIIVTLWNAEATTFTKNYIDTVVTIINGQITEKNGKR